MKLQEHYNATALAKKLDVHYKTVLYWFRKGKLKDARKSPTSNEILIPATTADQLLEDRGVMVR